MLIINVRQQIASKYNDPIIVSDAVNFPEVQFNFDSSWVGLNKTYQFTNGNISIDVETNDTILYIPHEVLKSGDLVVKVYGVKLNELGEAVERKVTITPLKYKVKGSELTESTNATEPTPEKYEQLRQIAEVTKQEVITQAGIVNTIKQAYDNGELKGDKGEMTATLKIYGME